MPIIKYFINAISILFFSSTSLAGTGFLFTHNARMEGLKTRQVTNITANEKIEINLTEPMLVEAAGRVSLLVVPAKDDSEVKIDAPLAQDIFNKSAQEEASVQLSSLLMGVTQVQKLIQGKNYREARESLQKLKSRFPNVAFLYFIEGSLLALDGNRPLAIESLEKGLKVHPDYEEGKAFLKKLRGDK